MPIDSITSAASPDPLNAADYLPGRGQRVQWTGLTGLSAARAIATAVAASSTVSVVVTPSSVAARDLAASLRFFLEGNSPQFLLPDWETLPYDPFSPHEDIVAERLQVLRTLPDLQHGVLIVPVQTLLQRVPPRAWLTTATLNLNVGDRFDIHACRRQLEASGYQAVDTVTGLGQFAVRGALLDLFPTGHDRPVRIDLFDNEIESLRYFDTETQRTVESVTSIHYMPAREFPFDPAAIARFRNNWHHTFNADVRRCSVYQDVSNNLPPAGIEYYLPFFFERLDTLFDYLPADSRFFFAGDTETAGTHFLQDVTARFENLRHDVERPILSPDALYLNREVLRELLAQASQIRVVSNNHGDEHGQRSHRHEVAFAATPVDGITFNIHAERQAADLLAYLNKLGGQRILFTAETTGRRQLLAEQLRRAGIETEETDGLQSFMKSSAPRGIAIAQLDSSALFRDLCILSESQLLGSRPAADQSVQTRGGRVVDPGEIIRNLTELHIGAPVIHLEHGVGRYLGLSTLEIDGASHEFLMLIYADDARLYVPVASLHLISRYSGADAETAPLHRLGSDQWEKARKRAAEKAADVAAELLDIHAHRLSRQSRAFQLTEADYQRFVAQFAFELTTDQAAAIDAVLEDLRSSQATDRLICGDVGFGKTEVAMRAAFVAVQNGTQVAVLVPTTLLAQQHGDSFRERFADWPVRIEVLSRLRTAGELRKAADDLAAGRIDIVIGTHKLLSDDFRYKDLGLVIIDEEHRFGVRQKERLKAMRAEVDILTLTATPIPRTLNMAMSGMRDLSIITTPPARRLSIKTFVQEKRSAVIREAISRELMRGGQVFYVHNEIQMIEEVGRELQAMVPEARIGIGHGQMAARQLERVMNDFYHRQLNVLLCTTIIETGIDVPNANTIIIDRADRFGLAQLHQLRGRVGRSHRQAYAYLLTPHRKAMTTDAVKRLEAIEAAGDLGVGFTLATHDLEIRGAGELLGEDQSGQIEAVGFTLYMEMLERAVQALKDGRSPDLGAPLAYINQEVNLHAPALIPEDYLPDAHTRLILYKRISGAATNEVLDTLQVELVDRFGVLPPQTRRLFAVTRLKLMAQQLGVRRFDLGPETGRIEFADRTGVDPFALIQLIQKEPSVYRLDGPNMIRIRKNLPEFEARAQFAENLCRSLLSPATNQRRASADVDQAVKTLYTAADEAKTAEKALAARKTPVNPRRMKRKSR
ncbi:MAG: transcription-repair coupling factor [Gammaproteobacteria bacterium]|nr:transcription-repair coupling factor [Gammaproteobacteria bacterium]